MPDTALPIADGFYVSRSLPISSQECVNWYPVINDGPALSPQSLFGTPGIHEVSTTGTDKQYNRGSHVKNGIPYFVNGDKLYRQNSDFTIDALGFINGDPTARVSIDDNGTQLMIVVPGVDGFIYDETSGTPFQVISDPDFKANGLPQQVVYIDGYFVVTTDSKKFIVSALNDGLSYDALDFATAEADPDIIVAPIVHNNQLFIGGSETIEVFQNVGGAAFPFQRVQGFVMSTGVSAAFSIVQSGKSFFFVGAGQNDTPSIYAFSGSDVELISTDAIDFLLSQLSDAELEDVFAWSYSQDGARFVGFTLADTTIVFDIDSGRWHERKSQIIDDAGTRTEKWRVNSLVVAYGKVLVGDAIDGRIGEINLDFFDEYGNDIIRRVSVVPLSNNGNSFKLPSIELTMESGVGEADLDPSIRLALSKDGKTYADERTRKFGKIGEYNKRAIWRRNGRFPRFCVMQFTMSDQVKPVIIKLEANVV